MAEEKQEQEKKVPRSHAFATLIGMGFGAAFLASLNGKGSVFQYGYPEYDEIGQTVVGCEIELNPETPIYKSYEAALYNINPQNMSYPDEKRIVKTAYYETSDGLKCVEMGKPNYQQYEQEILDNGGRLVVVLTVQADNQNDPEGFFNAGDIQIKIYGPVKK